MRRIRSLLAAAALVIAVPLAVPLQGRPGRTPDDLARALQQKYASIRDFSADFVQTYTGGVLRKTVTEKGHVLVKKPGKMRWEYTEPEDKLFISDGTRAYAYVPADRQVIVSPVESGTGAQTSVLFLAGRGDLVRDFDASTAEPPAGLPAGTEAVRLVPRSRQQDYDALVLAVAPDTLTLRGLVTTDAQGGESRFVFSHLKENVSPSDAQFTFKIPRGVDVITDAPPPGVAR
jgi:outer membrane lipoprotein carrier protein